MHAQRPPEEIPDKTVSQILQNLKRREQESDEIELDFFQKQRLWVDHHIRRLMAKRRQRITGEIPQLPQQPNQTPDAFEMPTEELRQEFERVSQSLNQPRHLTRNDGPPTQQLGNHDISMEETVIIRLSDTGDTPLVPTRLIAVDHAPRVSFHTSEKALIYLIDDGVKAHEQMHQTAPDVIEMPQEVYDLLLKIDLTEYATANRHIPFAVNTALHTNTLTHTIKCITY